jgi:hypothetical protein
MNPHIGDRARPLAQVRFQRRPRSPRVTGDGVVLDVADTLFIFTLGPRPVGRTSPRLESPPHNESTPIAAG